MTPERYERLGELYHAALEIEPESRRSFLEAACGTDEQLRREVESLLHAHNEVGNYFALPALEVAAGLVAKTGNLSLEGHSFLHFRVLSLIGVGGMGEVYLAEDTRLRRKVALKILPKEATQDQERVRRFEQEARAASALNHPNIVTIYEVGQIDGRHFIAAEYIEGQTLRERLNAGQVTVGEALEVGAQTASALEAAHVAGIVHRDIKPENIMLRPDGYVKVLDFGIAKLTERGLISVDHEGEVQAGGTTEAGLVLGTPRYMSPEQARGVAVDARTDIFSLGVMLYEMVGGRTPFGGATTSDVIAAILKDEPEPLVDAPEELELVIKKALTKERDARYSSGKELATELKRLKEEMALERLSPARPRREKAAATARATKLASRRLDSGGLAVSEGKRRRRSTMLLVAIVLLAVTAITVFSVVSLNRVGEEAPRSDPTDRQLTFKRGFVTAARFAPDGKTVIYSAAFEGGPLELYATDVEGVDRDSRSLKLPNAGIQSISATGEMAVLLEPELHWGESRNGTLALLPITGGTPLELMKEVWEASWGPKGEKLAIVHAPESEFQLEYPMGEVLYKSRGWISHARVSPLEDKIAFLDHPVLNNPAGNVVVIDLKTKDRSTVSTGWKTTFGLAWSAAGDEIWFTGSRENRKPNVYAVTISGRERLLYEVATHLRVQDIAPDGRLLLMHGDGGHSRMMYFSPAAKVERDLKTLDWPTSADLSADGTTLLYYEWGTAVNAVPTTYLCETDDDSAPAVKLGEGKALALSPNGQWALARREKTPQELVLLPTTPGEPKVLPRGAIQEYHHASWFPDNRQILFTALEPDSLPRSYFQDIEGGEPLPLTEEGIEAIRVSRDGKRLIVLNNFNGRYYFQPRDGGDLVPIQGIKESEEPIQWSDDGLVLYVRDQGRSRCNVYRVEVANGRRKLWRTINPPDNVGLLGLESLPGGVLITPDGQSYVSTFWYTILGLTLVEGLK
jgi:serine/threonine protein kinase/dipeptidyl aminopeptidase/acylaminoacyl peptidase